jgi:hypothetical protein
MLSDWAFCTELPRTLTTLPHIIPCSPFFCTAASETHQRQQEPLPKAHHIPAHHAPPPSSAPSLAYSSSPCCSSSRSYPVAAEHSVPAAARTKSALQWGSVPHPRVHGAPACGTSFRSPLSSRAHPAHTPLPYNPPPPPPQPCRGRICSLYPP